ncbi:MAG: 2-oxo acid dehydrogenase subunit E2 [Bryobacterales bacterium]|nr:2-oxo acid dehydrogenase subunit E2 [Bryobacterales bacterium]
MAIEITVPRLGWSMEEGVFSAWLKRDGEPVSAGEPLFAVESDKVTMDFESLDSGILHIPSGAPLPGDAVTPGQRLGYLLAKGEAVPQAAAVAVVHVETVAAQPGKAPVTPRASRVAQQLGVDTYALQGSGKGGRVREKDVREAFARKAEAPAAVESVPLTTLRRTIAARMMRSRENTAPVTLTRRVDATEMVHLRKQWKLRGGAAAPSYTDIVTKLAAAALQAHPLLAGRWEEDRIVLTKEIHIGIAVDTPHGLLVPVVRDVPSLTLEQVAARSRELIAAAQSRRIPAADLEGGVFTITNLGAFGVEAFTPMIQFPETAVLGMGVIRWEVVASGNGVLATREQMMLSLTFDHRLIDGAPAARFLQTLAGLIESPQEACGPIEVTKAARGRTETRQA